MSFVNRSHYRLRIGVVNNGNTKAASVQIFAKKLERQDGHGLYVRFSPFIERYVLWSDAESQTLDVLNPGFTAYAHLGNVFSTTDVPDNVRALAESVREGNLGTRTVLSLFPAGSWGQLFPPGKYKLTVIIGAANADPVERVLEVDLAGNWPGLVQIQNPAKASSGEEFVSNGKRGSATQGRLLARLPQLVEQFRIDFRAVTLSRDQSKLLTIELSEQPYPACGQVRIFAGSPKMRAKW